MAGKYDGWTEEDYKRELRRLNVHIKKFKDKIQRMDWDMERVDKAREIQQNFERQIQIQVALRTRDIMQKYFEFVHCITDILKERKR